MIFENPLDFSSVDDVFCGGLSLAGQPDSSDDIFAAAKKATSTLVVGDSQVRTMKKSRAFSNLSSLSCASGCTTDSDCSSSCSEGSWDFRCRSCSEPRASLLPGHPIKRSKSQAFLSSGNTVTSSPFDRTILPFFYEDDESPRESFKSLTIAEPDNQVCGEVEPGLFYDS